MPPLRCDYCHQAIQHGRQPYTLRMELFPAADQPLEISEAELQRDHRAALEELVNLMDAMSDDEVRAQEKLMFLRHSFTLCRGCRDRLATALERLGPADS